MTQRDLDRRFRIGETVTAAELRTVADEADALQQEDTEKPNRELIKKMQAEVNVRFHDRLAPS